MAKLKSRRRSALKEPEEVLSLAQSLLEPLKRHWRWVLAGGLIVAVAAAAWGINANLKAQREVRAGAALAGVKIKTSEPAQETAAVEALLKIIQEYPGAKAAQEAQLERAHLLYKLKNYAEAVNAYKAIQGRDPGLDNLAADSLSYCYEALGDFKQAAAALEPLEEKTSGPLQQEIYRRLGLLLEKAGDYKGAARYWSKLLEQPPVPGMAPYLQEKLAAAEAAAKK